MASEISTTTIAVMTTPETCLNVAIRRCPCEAAVKDHILLSGCLLHRPWECVARPVTIFHHRHVKCSPVVRHPADQ